MVGPTVNTLFTSAAEEDVKHCCKSFLLLEHWVDSWLT